MACRASGAGAPGRLSLAPGPERPAMDKICPAAELCSPSAGRIIPPAEQKERVAEQTGSSAGQKGRAAEQTSRWAGQIGAWVGPHCPLTIASDNGTEFHGYAKIEAATATTVYFARPHHPLQRGTNVNTNGLIRQYLPKGKSMAKLTRKQCDAVAQSSIHGQGSAMR